MKEIITLNIGGAGCRLGDAIVETFSREHGIDKDGFMSQEASQIGGLLAFACIYHASATLPGSKVKQGL